MKFRTDILDDIHFIFGNLPVKIKIEEISVTISFQPFNFVNTMIVYTDIIAKLSLIAIKYEKLKMDYYYSIDDSGIDLVIVQDKNEIKRKVNEKFGKVIKNEYL